MKKKKNSLLEDIALLVILLMNFFEIKDKNTLRDITQSVIKETLQKDITLSVIKIIAQSGL